MIAIEFDEDALEKIASIPIMIAEQAIKQCIPELVKPVIERAKAIAPSSAKSGTRKKWSKKIRNNPRWLVDSGQHVGRKILRHNKGATVYVGNTFPQGNKQQFNQNVDRGRKVVYWGKKTGKIYKPPYRTMQRAYDETREAQISGFRRKLEQVVKEMTLA